MLRLDPHTNKKTENNLQRQNNIFIFSYLFVVNNSGQIVAVFGAECESGDTFADGSVRYSMTSVNILTCSVSKDSGGQFSTALNGFQRKDPTFPVGLAY
ncbi:hypothetical protein MtrunA17_Chr8g0391031 [Medicago truncatula]|uniref:Uncharacterized protein n=1 Tax=Medicago truncatula TaxID=3880 RepID=A0A396GTK1_MEDTR|nr:hypothetical protein MtrunA17_Chr8g0391031 [Medicago truncatula]